LLARSAKTCKNRQFQNLNEESFFLSRFQFFRVLTKTSESQLLSGTNVFSVPPRTSRYVSKTNVRSMSILGDFVPIFIYI
jgi:hypothetical protein